MFPSDHVQYCSKTNVLIHQEQEHASASEYVKSAQNQMNCLVTWSRALLTDIYGVTRCDAGDHLIAFDEAQ